MQGLESLDKFKSLVSNIGGLGRYEDTYMVHAAEGETIIPMEVLDNNPILKKRLFETMRDMGIQPERYVVGNEFNSINPLTGQPEFFLKSITNRLKKAVRDIGSRTRKAAADVSGYAAPIMGAMYGPLAGAGVGALLGQYKRENPGDPNQALQMALRGGISGLGANLASGQGLTLGGGMRGIYNPMEEGTSFLQSINPMKIGKEFLENPTDMFLNKNETGLDRFKFLGGGGGGGAEQTINFRGSELKIPKKLLNKTVGEEQGLLEKIFGKNKILELIAKGYVSMKLGDVIKKENEEAAAEAEAKTAEYGKRTLPLNSVFSSLINPGELVQAPNTSETNAFAMAAEGGILDLDKGGELKGPGTGTSDSIPAMLSDGEFVMTAKAVRGAGGGDRREGARKMYEMMDNLERTA